MTTISTMPSDARVWVYQSDRVFSDLELNSIMEAGANFISDWAAHGASLKASFDVLHNLFIVIAVDEKQALASGCSIDKSVRFVKELEQKLSLNLFDRMQVAYRKGKEIAICKLADFEKLAVEGAVDATTIVFNNMVSTKAAFDAGWEVPLKKSWQSRVLV
ncbi:MAG TPA: ABC transporter ATPase [Bacteroidia bacterium]|jgi:soluble cytochrome b562